MHKKYSGRKGYPSEDYIALRPALPRSFHVIGVKALGLSQPYVSENLVTRLNCCGFVQMLVDEER